MPDINASDVLFWEKPGCVGNSQQKLFLISQGCGMQVRDLLKTSWTMEVLTEFFGSKPVAEWFNLSAPMIKSCVLDIHELTAPEALELMVAQPLLIRRPLMQYGELKQSGFESGPVLDSLGITLPMDNDLQSCPMTDADRVSVCEVSL